MTASKYFVAIGVVAVLSLVSTKPSEAQELRRYQPASPTVSPYLNLGRFNTSGLPNYYTLVRPLNRQRQVNLRTERLQRQQSITLLQLERAVQQRGQVSEVTTGTGSRFLNPGSRAVYRDTLQFYPPVNLRR